MTEDRAMSLFELIRLQAEVDAMAGELADIAEADLRVFEAAELEAMQRGLPFEPMTAEECEQHWRLIKQLRHQAP